MNSSNQEYKECAPEPEEKGTNKLGVYTKNKDNDARFHHKKQGHIICSWLTVASLCNGHLWSSGYDVSFTR